MGFLSILTWRPSWGAKIKIIKLRNISFSNMDFEILKAAMLASKSTMLKGDEQMPGKMSPGGGNNAKANEWNFYE